MCDFVSWIKKDRKLYWLEDAMIEAQWPDRKFRDTLGHEAVQNYYGKETYYGTHLESAIKLPKEIARAVNEGKMRKMAKAGGWAGVHYDKNGNIDVAWWLEAKETLESLLSGTRFMTNKGPEPKNVYMFQTEGEAVKAYTIAWWANPQRIDAPAEYAVKAAVTYNRREAARSLAELLMSPQKYRKVKHTFCVSVGWPLAELLVSGVNCGPQFNALLRRLDIWKAGYGIAGVLGKDIYAFRSLV